MQPCSPSSFACQQSLPLSSLGLAPLYTHRECIRVDHMGHTTPRHSRLLQAPTSHTVLQPDFEGPVAVLNGDAREQVQRPIHPQNFATVTRGPMGPRCGLPPQGTPTLANLTGMCLSLGNLSGGEVLLFPPQTIPPAKDRNNSLMRTWARIPFSPTTSRSKWLHKITTNLFGVW